LAVPWALFFCLCEQALSTLKCAWRGHKARQGLSNWCLFRSWAYKARRGPTSWSNHPPAARVGLSAHLCVESTVPQNGLIYFGMFIDVPSITPRHAEHKVERSKFKSRKRKRRYVFFGRNAQTPLIRFVVNLLYSLLYNKSTTNRISGVLL